MVAVRMRDEDVADVAKVRSQPCEAPRDTVACIDHAATPPDLLTVIGLFIGGGAVASDPLRAACGDEAFAALLALGLAAVSAAFVATTLRSPVTAAVYVFLVAGLAQASVARRTTDAADAADAADPAAPEPSPGRPPGGLAAA